MMGDEVLEANCERCELMSRKQLGRREQRNLGAMPEILLIHLSRFMTTLDKNEVSIDFPEMLDLTEFSATNEKLRIN